MSEPGKNRLPMLLAALLLAALLRWLDPLSYIQRQPATALSAPVERNMRTQAVIASASVIPITPTVSNHEAWPVRMSDAESAEKASGNAFLTRSEASVLEAKRHPAPPPPPPPLYVPPPPPPPVEPPPPLQVIGTWGGSQDMAVFLVGPQGTVLAKSGETLMGQYRVQAITKGQITLEQIGNQRIWNIPIPAAPSTLQTWPGR